MNRREFVLGAAATTFMALTTRKASAWQSQQRRINIDANVAIATIRPELHSQFAEHLGSCIYGGLWVGSESSIPNISGYRKQAIDYLRPLEIPVLRWPGGCFADDYHWRDGIGTPSKRPKRVNIHWGNYTEDNSFGTHEFVGLCRLLGAQPYFAGNVGSGTPEELRDWVEYCNYPSGSTLSDERAANGSPEPFAIKYWGVGNENWGCGGNMRPEEYAGLYRRYSTYVHQFGETRPFLIACGPNGNNPDWSRRFLETVERRLPNGFSMHFYSNGKNPATQYTVESMQEQFSSFTRVEQAIQQQRALLDGFDPDRKVGLLVDEWGVWDRILPDDEKAHGRLFQPITMRSAVAAALGLNVFHRQADKLYMCNIAQMVNVLHSLLLTEGAKCVRTTTYYVFDMMKSHRGRTAIRVETPAEESQGLSVSASRSDRELVLTLVNPKHDAAIAVDCGLIGVTARSATAQLLHDSDFNAANTFETPDRITPSELRVQTSSSRLTVELPPLSVVTAKVALA